MITVEDLAKAMLELREFQKETSIEIRNMQIEAKNMQKETRRIQEETSLQMQETDRKLKSIGIQLGNMSKNQGEIAEEYFINSLKNKLQIADLKFDVLLSNVELQTKKVNDEFDILLVNGNSLAVIEVKYKVHPNDLEKLEKKMKHIKLMPSYKNYKVYAGIAGFKIPKSVLRDAKEKGYFTLQKKGDIIIENSKKLKVA